MLEFHNDTICEQLMTSTTTNTMTPGRVSWSTPHWDCVPPTTTVMSPFTYVLYWHDYPVYVCTDKTKKAIEVLKSLQASKALRCDTVPRFIALVEQIAAVL